MKNGNICNKNCFSLGDHLKPRDTKPVKKTLSGFIKLLHPDGQYTKADIKEYLEVAHEMRRPIKEQLKRIGGKNVIVPLDNLNELANVPPSVLGNTDVPFYQNNQMLMQKALLMD